MIELLELFGSLIIISICVAVVLIALWFVIGIVISFYRIYIQNPEREKRFCKHASSQYTDEHPELPWKCCDCGKMHK